MTTSHYGLTYKPATDLIAYDDVLLEKDVRYLVTEVEVRPESSDVVVTAVSGDARTEIFVYGVLADVYCFTRAFSGHEEASES